MKNRLSPYKEKCDALAKKRMILLHGTRCIDCGRDMGKYIEAGHFWGRWFKSIQWHIDNIFPQCTLCNAHHESSTIRSMEPMRTNVIRRLKQLYGDKEGQDRFDRLRELGKKLVKLSVSKLTEIADEIKKDIERLEEEHKEKFGV